MKNQISISLTDQQLKKVDLHARQKSMSRSQLLRMIVASYLNPSERHGYNMGFISQEAALLDRIDYEKIKLKSELKKLEYQSTLIKDKLNEQ
tara:strand:- start:564 stop:839 length:276 start_codon:yes stop_codon:yes gene_type:complete